MTIYDIAKQAGVSASTVSRVINNKPGINAQTRKRVQKLLNETHYPPNEADRGLVMQSSKIIGILIEDLRIEHHTESAYVIEQEMTALGYTCITLSTGRRDEKKADYIRILEQRRVDGAILMGSMFETEAVKKSIKEHLPDVPVAIVNGYLDLPNVYGILIDEERGVKDCAELMFKKGKKHLVMAVDSDTPSNRNKQKGYLRAMLEQGIAKEDIPFYTAVNKEFTNPRDVRAAGAKLTEQILTERPETDGIIYTTDLLAVGGLEAAKKMGCWQENDAYVPSPGDAILYDWQDNGISDNTGNPDHVGTVIEVYKESGYMVIEEGNYSNAVKKRTLSINGKFIRGFITPKYDDNTVAAPGLSKGKDIKTIAHEVIVGLWESGENRKKLLTEYGYNYSEVQNMVNQILNGSAVTPSNTKQDQNQSVSKKVVATCSAKQFNKAYAGEYKTTAVLYCRNDAGTNKKALCKIPAGTKVKCYGYYTMVNGVKWLYIQFVLDGVQYTGFSSSAYLAK